MPTKVMMEQRRYKGKIRNKLIATFLVPIMVLVVLFGIFAYMIAREGLEAELSKRLISIALAAGTQISADTVANLLPGDESTRLYRNTRAKLLKLKAVNEIQRIYVFTADNRSLVDTSENYAIGDFYARHTFDRDELERVKAGIPTSSILFRGVDGQFYKTGYAAVAGDRGRDVFIGVEGSAQFYGTLNRLNRSLFWLCATGVMVIVVASFVFSKRIVSPIQHLLKSVSRISKGELNIAIDVAVNDEIGMLSHAFNEMRKNLLERDRRMQMMLQGIAHEVRNPLGGIEIFVGLLEEEMQSTESIHDHIQKIKREVGNLNDIVNEFLDYAKGVTINKKAVDLLAFVNEVAMYYTVEMETNHITMELDIDMGDEKVMFDPEYMKRAFLNLFKNAIQSQPEGGRIAVIGRIENQRQHGKMVHEARIQIQDEGVGIDESDLPKLFTPFFTTKEKGTGLGLPFVKKIIEAHGGAITITNRADRGAIVAIALPV